MRKRRTLSHPWFSRWVVGSIILLTVFSAPVQKLQGQGTHECLDIYKWGRMLTGRFDITQGIYTEIAEAKGVGNRFPSPDGRLIGYVEQQEKNTLLVIATAEGITEQTFKLPSGSDRGIGLYWSPDGRYIATMVAREGQTVLAIAALDTQTLHTFPQTEVISAFMESPLSWSPDSRYLALSEEAQSLSKDSSNGYFTIALSLYNVGDGLVLHRVARQMVGYQDCGETCISHAPYEWASDGSAIFYVLRVPESENLFNAMVYRIPEQKAEVLTHINLTDFPLYRQDHQYALLQWKTQNTTYGGVLDTRSGQVTVLDSQAESALDLWWMADTPFLRWDTYLSWANTDGTRPRRFNIGSGSKLPRWPSTMQQWGSPPFDLSPDGRWLVFSVTKPDKRSFVWALNYDSGRGGGSASGWIEKWVPHSTIDDSFISPDSKTAVIMGDNQFYIVPLGEMRPQGGNPLRSMERSFRSMPGIHQIVWSPDNTRFAVMYSTARAFDLFKTDGTLILHYDKLPEMGEPPSFRTVWTDCPPVQPD